MGTRYHIHAEKRWVKAQIREFGVQAVLGDEIAGMTEADAMQLVDDLASKYVPVGDSCDNRDEDGVCQGHPTEDK